MIGSTPIPIRTTIDSLFSFDSELTRFSVIIRQIRLPRVILSFLVGSALAIAGAVFQGIIRNPMVDPYIVGISAGAGTAATIAIIFNMTWSLFYFNTIPLFAFIGAIITVVLVYNISKVGNKIPVMNFLLAGVAIGFILDAIRSFLMVTGTNDMQQVVFWLMGSLAGTSWRDIRIVLPYYFIGLIPILLYIKDLNIILLGEDNAQTLGVEVEKVKKTLITSATLITAAVVSVSGSIGFIGLVMPHMARMLIGPDHRKLIPFAAILGGIFLMVSDMLARSLMPPLEIPVGIITAIAGGPYFIYLLRKNKSGGW
ncbi:iron chelate uptake ABC transporter family permease subunit [Halanaerobiaceae bacterium Z-7014]|uniref:Iron chelate uptake ABC transporter family permease subunit n=2 Tax=Halonatronomonas betaini TaxID=2778430 RepID=A0A931AUI3_9FIRM|nr:iron chelate uptake ABC transporter family permease subunit [Halonatronomonas betaini]